METAVDNTVEKPVDKFGDKHGDNQPNRYQAVGSCGTLTLGAFPNLNRSWIKARFVSRETLVTSISPRKSREKH